MTEDFKHQPIMTQELVKALSLETGATAIDCTAGGGGHTRALLEAVGETGRVYSLDRDEKAVLTLNTKLVDYLKAGQLEIEKLNFKNLPSFIERKKLFEKVSAVCADIGLSSIQLDDPDRGFSFQKDGPLDMRMDQSQKKSAKDIVMGASKEELTTIFKDFGEEPKAKHLANVIVNQRSETEITTTKQLANLIAANVHYKKQSKKHPATKVFQALRISVNSELEELEGFIKGGFRCLKKGGRLGIITFHSLEDRIVKKAFKDFEGKNKIQNIPRELPLTDQQLKAKTPALGKIIKPFPIIPSDSEIQSNPRARSAKLRVIEKLQLEADL